MVIIMDLFVYSPSYLLCSAFSIALCISNKIQDISNNNNNRIGYYPEP